MLTLFRLIIFRNWKSLLILFVVILSSSVGFVTLGQLTTNIKASVARETRPLFWADIIIFPEGYTGVSLHDVFAPYLSGESYTWAERHGFSTTLFDHDRKTGLVKVVAYTGSYPQRGILKAEKIGSGENIQKISATPELITRFASGNMISLDGKNIEITEKIVESSDMGFSLGTENHLLILPESLLSGSMLLSSGSRLDYDLLISFSDERRAKILTSKWESIESLSPYRIRNYEDRSERNLEVVEELTDYILLILVVSSIFALVILRSAHDTFFDTLARTLRIVEILGFSRFRQTILFLILYVIIIPLAFLLGGVISYFILDLVSTYPGAENFWWFFSSFFISIFLLVLLILAWFFPAWQERWFPSEETLVLENLDSRKKWTLQYWTHLVVVRISDTNWWKNILQSQNSINVLIGIIVIAIIFEDVLFAFGLVLGMGAIFWILAYIFIRLYQWIFALATPYREKKFLLFDALRTLVRPMAPTIPITLSLISVTTFFVVFILFSLAFRSELTLDAGKNANIFALNILESDREKVEKVLSGAEMYSILRARISNINGKTLAEHLGTERPSGEFSREFNVTITPLQNAILRWKNTINTDEVSLDDAFARRLGVDIGDKIDFLLSGKKISLTVASIRESTRQGFHPFFYFSFDPSAFRNAPKTYFASAYTTDPENWKKTILANSGPHVTFIDIENILSLVRDISEKILTVIGLFLACIWVFAVFAIVSFFSRMRWVESMKFRLYELFGLIPEKTQVSLRLSRMMIFVVSWIFSLVLGVVILWYIVRASSILSMSWVSVGWVILGVLFVYSIFVVILRPKK